MNVELSTSFYFEAAHRIPTLPPSHKCTRVHGHNYRVDVHIAGDVDEASGLLMDFGELKGTVKPLIDSLDHRDLNDIDGLAVPTSEMLARYIWDRLYEKIPLLSAVCVRESPDSKCIYRGN